MFSRVSHGHFKKCGLNGLLGVTYSIFFGELL